VDEPTKAVFKSRFQRLLADNPKTVRLMRSAEEVNSLDMERVMASGASAVCTFENYDEALFAFISKCLSEGKQVAITAAGPRKLMVTAAHGLFRAPGKQLDQDRVHAVMDGLERLRKRYHDDQGRELLTGGLDSWIYPEKYVDMAQKYGFAKHKTFDRCDETLLTEVEAFLKRNKMVIVAAWEEKAEVYLEPHYPKTVEQPPAKSGGCFIATAACGHTGAPEIAVLSAFRDDFLAQTGVGRALIRLYYSVSPPIASIIARSRVLRYIAMVGAVRPAVRALRAFGHSEPASADQRRDGS